MLKGHPHKPSSSNYLNAMQLIQCSHSKQIHLNNVAHIIFVCSGYMPLRVFYCQRFFINTNILNAQDSLKFFLNFLNVCLCSSSTEAAIKPTLPATGRWPQVACTLSQCHAPAHEGEWQVMLRRLKLKRLLRRYRREEDVVRAVRGHTRRISVHCQALPVTSSQT